MLPVFSLTERGEFLIVLFPDGTCNVSPMDNPGTIRIYAELVRMQAEGPIARRIRVARAILATFFPSLRNDRLAAIARSSIADYLAGGASVDLCRSTAELIWEIAEMSEDDRNLVTPGLRIGLTSEPDSGIRDFVIYDAAAVGHLCRWSVPVGSAREQMTYAHAGEMLSSDA
ncbi:hypothetical protein ASF70_12935 [Rhizobium sp. Leaf321]|nr:hypothetical protein ASF70_12935 [Rhizobium sp. Leaf321]